MWLIGRSRAEALGRGRPKADPGRGECSPERDQGAEVGRRAAAATAGTARGPGAKADGATEASGGRGAAVAGRVGR